MINSLIDQRDRFCKSFPEKRHLVNGRDWGAIQAGTTGPALVLLPGTLGRADIFWQQIEALQGQVRILSLSYPGTGGIEDWCADISALMQVYDIDKATILGSSLGGYVVQYFAATQPEMVDNLVAANTMPSTKILANMPPYNSDIDALPRDDLMRGFRDGLTQWAIEEPTRTDLVALLLAEVAGRIPEQELRARLKALKFGPELPAQSLPKSSIFTVESQDDRLIPEPVRKALRARLDPGGSTVFQNGSHFPYLTKPAAYTAMLCDILGL